MVCLSKLNLEHKLYLKSTQFIKCKERCASVMKGRNLVKEEKRDDFLFQDAWTFVACV